MVSVMWKSEISLHALDHQVNLDLEAMVSCVMTAFWMIGLELPLGMPGTWLARWWLGCRWDTFAAQL